MIKIYALIIYIIFLVSPVAALMPIMMSTGAGCYGNGVFDGSPGDTETFEYATDDFCTYIRSGPVDWTINEPSGVIDTYDTTVAKNGTHSISFTDDGGDSETSYIEADIVDDNNYSIEFWFYIDTAFGTVGDYIRFVGNSLNRPRVELYKSGANMVIQYYAGSAYQTGTYAISTSTWYKIKADYNPSGSSTCKIYDSSETLQETLTESSSINSTATTLRIGASITTGLNTEQYSLYMDDIIYNSDGD